MALIPFTLTEIVVWFIAVFLLVKILRSRGKYSSSWRIMTLGFFLFLVSQLMQLSSYQSISLFKYTVSILASITIMYGVWKYYYKIFIYHKKNEEIQSKSLRWIILFLIVLECLVIIIIPQIFLIINSLTLLYVLFLEKFFWVVIGIFGLVYVIDIKARLPKLFLIYFLHIKKTTDVLLLTFSLMFLNNLFELLYLYGYSSTFHIVAQQVLTPIFGLSMVLVIYYSIETRILREKDLQYKGKGNEQLTIRNIMIRNVVTCTEDISIKEASEFMGKNKVGSLVVTDVGVIKGIVTDRDISLAVAKNLSVDVKVKDIMTSEIISAHPTMAITEALSFMQDHKIKRMPIIDNGTMCGIITQTTMLDIMNSFAFEIGKIMEKHKLLNVVDEDKTYSLKIFDIMKKDVVSTSSSKSVHEVACMLYDSKIGSVVVMDGEKILGVFTENDLVRKVVSKGKSVKSSVKHFVSRTENKLHPGMSIFDASNLMKKHGFKRMPVVENGKLVGIVTQGLLLSSMNKLASKIVSLKITRKQKYFLKPGVSYLMKEDSPDISFDVFSEKTGLGTEGLCISRTITSRLKSKYSLDNVPVIWLTEQQAENVIKPTQLEKLSYTINRFLDTVDKGIVLLDGVEYLVNYTNFKEVLHLLQNLSDTIAMHGSNLIVTVNPRALDPKELSLLERTFDVFSPEDKLN